MFPFRKGKMLPLRWGRVFPFTVQSLIELIVIDGVILSSAHSAVRLAGEQEAGLLQGTDDLLDGPGGPELEVVGVPFLQSVPNPLSALHLLPALGDFDQEVDLLENDGLV